jgi:type II secretory pathway pseudopilin PulG
VEVLVAIGLFGVLSTILLGLALSTSDVSQRTREVATVAEEARLGMERITRELRQADRIKVAHLQVAPGDHTTMTLVADFNGDNCIDSTAVDPEEVTYDWDPGAQQLTISARVGSETKTERLLAAKVTDLRLSLNSSAWQYDLPPANGGPPDGTTTAAELDASPIGDRNIQNFTTSELQFVDLVGVSMTVTDGTQRLTYETQVDLRNQDRKAMPPC